MRILVCDLPDSMAPDPAQEARILRAGLGAEAEVVHHPYDPADHDAFLAELARADALLTGFLPVPREVLDAAGRLRCISLNATGYDNVDLAAARERGIAVMCIGEYCTEDVAEHTLALALALNHDLKRHTDQIERHARWSYASGAAPVRFVDQTLGIIGLGRIGSNVARKARAWGLTVLACDPYVPADAGDALGVPLLPRDEVLARADIVSNHMNATAENVGYFDAATFAAMARRPVFLNTARGSAVVEADLVAALDGGHLRGAGLDVLATERPDLATHPLVGRPNVIITPHSAYYSTASEEALMRISCENIVHYLNGDHDRLFKRVG